MIAAVTPETRKRGGFRFWRFARVGRLRCAFVMTLTADPFSPQLTVPPALGVSDHLCNYAAIWATAAAQPALWRAGARSIPRIPLTLVYLDGNVEEQRL